MKNTWAQPSLSRDFALLAAAILFVLFLISAWVGYSTFTKHSYRVKQELEQEAQRVEKLFSKELDETNYMLTSLGRQLILNREIGLVDIAQILKSFDSRGNLFSTFSFVDKQERIVVSSNKGVLEKPVDITDRDYASMMMGEPWKMQLGKPVKGRVSERWVMPAAMGITDYTGKYIGGVLIGLDVQKLIDDVNILLKRDGLSFVILTKDNIQLTRESTEEDISSRKSPKDIIKNVDLLAKPNGLIANGSIFFGDSSYTYYHSFANYPYVVILEHDSAGSDENVRNQLWSRLLQIIGFATFFVLFLWIMRARMIRPVLDLTQRADAIARGETYTPTHQGGPVEIEGLSVQMGRISEYLAEARRIEDELRNKMFMLKKSKEQAEIEKHSKSEFLAYICQELRTPINHVLGLAQVMKDQLYGPIENKKYRQCAADIYQASNTVLGNLSDLLAFTKAEISHKEAANKVADVSLIINNTLQFLADRLEEEHLQVRTVIQEHLPHLLIESFRLQQVISNIMLYAITQATANAQLELFARIASEGKDRKYMVIGVGVNNDQQLSQSELVAIAEDAMHELQYPTPSASITHESIGDAANLNLELARMLLGMHQCGIDIRRTSAERLQILIFFGPGRLLAEEKN
jgi:signal transduction histidine kinase